MPRAGVFGLALPTQLLDEQLVTLTTKPYLANGVEADDAAAFVAALRALAEPAPASARSAPVCCVTQRTTGHLLAASYAAHVDYLVSGDEDPHALQEVVTRTTSASRRTSCEC